MLLKNFDCWTWSNNNMLLNFQDARTSPRWKTKGRFFVRTCQRADPKWKITCPLFIMSKKRVWTRNEKPKVHFLNFQQAHTGPTWKKTKVRSFWTPNMLARAPKLKNQRSIFWIPRMLARAQNEKPKIHLFHARAKGRVHAFTRSCVHAFKGLPHAQTKGRVHAFTRSCVNAFTRSKVPPRGKI